jgi:rare lipoprotein A (peptidoglycan hydrolase)
MVSGSGLGSPCRFLLFHRCPGICLAAPVRMRKIRRALIALGSVANAAPSSRSAAALILAAMLAAGPTVSGAALPASSTTRPPRPEAGSVQAGYASWYGKWHHGGRTANGEMFDMHELTAAHRKLPLGTRLRVINLRNGRVTTVRVNDRGPYVAGRIIDLSYAAARQVGAVHDGVFPVQIRVVSFPRPDGRRRPSLPQGLVALPLAGRGARRRQACR